MKAIVSTTINKPTEATLKFCWQSDWIMIMVGDKKTPHDDYFQLEKRFSNFKYLHPDEQEKKYKKISDIIGWNCIQRRPLGYIEAYNMGAEIIATVDDDNIPYDDWGKNLLVNKTVNVNLYECDAEVFDPLSITNQSHLWYRGYPIDLLKTRHNVNKKGKVKRKVLIQADLWDGDPDIDAMARLTYRPSVRFDVDSPYCSNKISPFNSQNTFISREVFPHYVVLPHVGRMDDIWGGYIAQYYYPDSVVYSKPTVCQVRNEHDIITDLEKEIIGYRYTLDLINDLANYKNYLPDRTKVFVDEYRKAFK
jgi:hypothetical protein